MLIVFVIISFLSCRTLLFARYFFQFNTTSVFLCLANHRAQRFFSFFLRGVGGGGGEGELIFFPRFFPCFSNFLPTHLPTKNGLSIKSTKRSDYS